MCYPSKRRGPFPSRTRPQWSYTPTRAGRGMSGKPFSSDANKSYTTVTYRTGAPRRLAYTNSSSRAFCSASSAPSSWSASPPPFDVLRQRRRRGGHRPPRFLYEGWAGTILNHLGAAAAAGCSVWMEWIASGLNLGGPPSRKCTNLGARAAQHAYGNRGAPESFLLAPQSVATLLFAPSGFGEAERGFPQAPSRKECNPPREL